MVILRDMKAAWSTGIVHVMAELSGIPELRLRDRALLGGLLIAAAGAAGVHTASAPMLQLHDDRGIDGLLMLECGHIAVHAFAERHILLVDVFAPEPAAFDKAVAVFTRRLSPASVTVERTARLSAL